MDLLHWILIGALGGSTAIFFLLSFFRGKREKDYQKEVKDLTVNALQAYAPMMEMIFSFFVSLWDVQKMQEIGELPEKFRNMRADMVSVKNSISNVYEFNKEIKAGKTLDLKMAKLLTSYLRIINTSLYQSSINIISGISNFSQEYIFDKNIVNRSSRSMAEIIYYLSSMVPILSDFSGSSNEVSKEIIMGMVDKFNMISEFSSQITSDIGNTMNDLMDEAREDSLAYVVKKAQDVLNDFEMFFEDMQKLKVVSNNFVEKSVEKLKGIEDIANSIEDIAETIKVISLNVSIEAANTGNIARGFQVLARDLRQFASRTSRFAGDVKSRVHDAMMTTESLKEDYLDKMNDVYEYVQGIRESLEVFGSIISKSFDSIKSVIESLQDFSHKIENGIKDVVGQLQYYDVRSQEVEHISDFIEGILQRFYADMDQTRINEVLNEDDQLKIRKDILKGINDHITTSNERKILEKYEDEYGIQVSSPGDHTRSEDENEDIYVF